MAVNYELARPQTEGEFEAMCLELYRRVLSDPGLMRVGRGGQAQFGVDLLGADRRTPSPQSIGIQCKHYQATRFTLRTVTDDVHKVEQSGLQISHLIFATSAASSADVVKKVHELSVQRQGLGKFTVSVDYWNAIEGHIRMHPEVGRAFIPGYPGSSLLEIRDQLGDLQSQSAQHVSNAQQILESLKTGQAAILERLPPSVRAAPPDPKGDEADPGVTASLNFVRDRLREGKTVDAQKLLNELGDPGKFRDSYSKFRWHTNSAAIALIDGRANEAADGFIRAFEFAPDDEKAHLNKVQALLIRKQFEAADQACCLALARHPNFAPLWGLRIHIDKALGKPAEGTAIPDGVRHSSDFLFALARIHADRGDQVEAVRLLRQCLDLDAASLDAKRAYLAEALHWAGNKHFLALLGQMPEEARTVLTDALQRFEPIEELLSGLQSANVVDELATNITSALIVLSQEDRAKAIARQLIARHPDVEQLLRVHVLDLAERGDTGALKTLSQGRLHVLPPPALATLAEAAANSGDLQWHDEIARNAAERVADEQRLSEVATLRPIALWHANRHDDALRSAQDYAHSNPGHVSGRVILARILMWLKRSDEAKKEALDCASKLAPNQHVADILHVADVLAVLGCHSEAALLYERLVQVPRADVLTTKWLKSLVAADQRKKALLVLDELLPADRSVPSIRRVEINLAAHMLDWPRMRVLLEQEIGSHPPSADIAVGYATVLHRLSETAVLRDFLERNPELAKGSVDQEIEYAKLQVAAGCSALGIRLLFKAFRAHPNNTNVAGAFLVQLLIAPDIRQVIDASTAIAGEAILVRDESESWWIAIDDPSLQRVESWPELVSADSELALSVGGSKVGDVVRVVRGPVTVDGTVVGKTSLIEFAVAKAHELLASPTNSTGPVWSVKIFGDDGRPDINALLSQARERRQHGEKVLEIYRKHRLPMNLLAKMLGTDPVNLLLEWPGSQAALFVGIGSEEERDAGRALLQRHDKRFVIDIFTIAELLRHGGGQAALRSIGRMLVPQSQRQLMLNIMQPLSLGEKTAVVSEHADRLRIQELPPSYGRRRSSFLTAMLAFIDQHCDVVPVAGPEVLSKPLQDLVKFLDRASADAVLLCAEMRAALLTEDGGLRLLAAQAGIVESVGVQPVLMSAVDRQVMSRDEYANALATKILAHHDFVSVNGLNLADLAVKTPTRVHPAVRAAIDAMRLPTLLFRSGVKACADFIHRAAAQLPPETVGKYVSLCVDALSHGRDVRPRLLQRVFAQHLRIYGRNGRKLPRHVRALFSGTLSRHLLR